MSKYLGMAFTERIALKSKWGYIELKPSTELRVDNPSPSGDTWFDDPQNMAEFERGLTEARTKPLDEFVTWEELKKTLDL